MPGSSADTLTHILHPWNNTDFLQIILKEVFLSSGKGRRQETRKGGFWQQEGGENKKGGQGWQERGKGEGGDQRGEGGAQKEGGSQEEGGQGEVW